MNESRYTYNIYKTWDGIELVQSHAMPVEFHTTHSYNSIRTIHCYQFIYFILMNLSDSLLWIHSCDSFLSIHLIHSDEFTWFFLMHSSNSFLWIHLIHSYEFIHSIHSDSHEFIYSVSDVEVFFMNEFIRFNSWEECEVSVEFIQFIVILTTSKWINPYKTSIHSYSHRFMHLVHSDESCRSGMSFSWMNHGTHMNECCNTYEHTAEESRNWKRVSAVTHMKIQQKEAETEKEPSHFHT